MLLAWNGRVVGVSDGDTVTVINDKNEQFKIRLSGIDAPEKGQPFGKNSKELLSNLVYDKLIEVIPVATDKYGRTVAHLHVGSIDVEEEMVRSGLAWVYDKYCTDPICTEWRHLQTQAHEKKIGLWSETLPTPPWEWRHGAQNTQKNSNSSQSVHLNKAFHGNISTHVFHTSICKYYNCNKCVENFDVKEDAIRAGYL